jgi:hypothetical protein
MFITGCQVLHRLGRCHGVDRVYSAQQLGHHLSLQDDNDLSIRFTNSRPSFMKVQLHCQIQQTTVGC